MRKKTRNAIETLARSLDYVHKRLDEHDKYRRDLFIEVCRLRVRVTGLRERVHELELLSEPKKDPCDTDESPR